MATCPKCRAHYSDDQNHCEVDGEALLPDAAVANFDGELQQGELVGEYRIEKKIGEGGFGKVYAAVHPVIGKRAAIKVLNREYSSNAMVVSRFVSEAKAVNQIRHRNIIDIFSFGSLPGGLQYLVMELLDGETLDAYLEKNKRIPPDQALPILHRIAKALDAAHAAGIAHRDLKPENIFLCFDDEGGVYPKLLDFGIAKLMGDADVHHKTRTGAAMGTPLYMSPEQCRGKGVDHRTDLYSFGVMVHEILTGKLPFDGDSMMDLMFKHAQAPPPPMSSVNPEVPAALDGPVLHFLQKDPATRPASVTAGVEAMVDAARSIGLEVSIKKATTLGGVSGGGMRGLPSGVGATVAQSTTGSGTLPVGSTVAQTPAQTNPGASHTFQTVEKGPAASGSKTWIVAAAALVIGIGATFALTRGSGDESANKPAAPAMSSEPEPASEPKPATTTTPEPQPGPTSSVTTSPSPSASASASPASPTSGPTPAPSPLSAQPKPTPTPTPTPTPAPVQPLPKPPPSDLESPF